MPVFYRRAVEGFQPCMHFRTDSPGSPSHATCVEAVYASSACCCISCGLTRPISQPKQMHAPLVLTCLALMCANSVILHVETSLALLSLHAYALPLGCQRLFKARLSLVICVSAQLAVQVIALPRIPLIARDGHMRDIRKIDGLGSAKDRQFLTHSGNVAKLSSH